MAAETTPRSPEPAPIVAVLGLTAADVSMLRRLLTEHRADLDRQVGGPEATRNPRLLPPLLLSRDRVRQLLATLG